MHLPLPPGGFIAKRSGNDVVLRFTIPEANTDRTTPADVVRVEVYAHTGPLPTPQDYLKFGTLVAVLPITRPVTPDQAQSEQQRAEGKGQAVQSEEQRAESQARAGANGEMLEQGWATSVSETLTAADLELGPLPYTRQLPTVPVVEVVETPGTVNLPPPIVALLRGDGRQPEQPERPLRRTLGVLIAPPPPVDGLNAKLHAERALAHDASDQRSGGIQRVSGRAAGRCHCREAALGRSGEGGARWLGRRPRRPILLAFP